jgi:hypothetical protein
MSVDNEEKLPILDVENVQDSFNKNFNKAKELDSHICKIASAFIKINSPIDGCYCTNRGNVP